MCEKLLRFRNSRTARVIDWACTLLGWFCFGALMMALFLSSR